MHQNVWRTSLTWAVGLLAALSLLGFAGERSWIFDLAAHFRVQYALALILAGTLALAFRRPALAVAAAVLVVVNVGVVAPYTSTWPSAEASRSRALRVAQLNVNHGRGSVDRLLDFLESWDPDVAVLEEVRDGWHEALDRSRARYPYQLAESGAGAYGVALLSKHPISDAEVLYFVDRRNPSVAASIATPRGSIRVLGTHAYSPVGPTRSRMRDEQLEAIARMLRERPSTNEPLVDLGDLNTTPWGHGFKRLVAESGLRDTSVGAGLAWSWPSWFWPLAISIDHCLVSPEVRVVQRQVGPHVGSDHFPVVIDLELP